MRHLAGYIAPLLLGAAVQAQPPVTVSPCAAPPVIDGRLDESCWSSAAALTGFVQTRPGDNIPASRETALLVLHDAETVYFGIRAADDPAKVRATVARRDDVLDDDHVLIYLDTFDDRRRAYVLIFNPLGIQQDGVYTEGRETDYSVDVVMQSKGTVTADGYTVEVALPLSSIRYRAGAGRRWGVHVQRRIRHRDEEDSWRPLVRGNAGLLAMPAPPLGNSAAPFSQQICCATVLLYNTCGGHMDCFDRDKEAERLWRHFKNGRNVLMLAPRRMGKTVLLERLKDESERKGFRAISSTSRAIAMRRTSFSRCAPRSRRSSEWAKPSSPPLPRGSGARSKVPTTSRETGATCSSTWTGASSRTTSSRNWKRAPTARHGCSWWTRSPSSPRRSWTARE